MKLEQSIAATVAVFIAASTILVTVRLLDARDAKVVNVEGEGEWERIGAVDSADSSGRTALSVLEGGDLPATAPSLSDTDAYYAQLDLLRESQRLFDSDEARVARVLKATLPSVAITDEEWAYIGANAHIWSVEGDVLERAIEYLKPARVWAATEGRDSDRATLLEQWVEPEDAAAVLRLPVDVVNAEMERLIHD